MLSGRIDIRHMYSRELMDFNLYSNRIDLF